MSAAARRRLRGPPIAFAVLFALASNARAVHGATTLDATYLGGSDQDKVLAVASDSAGDTYVAGLTTSLDFPLLNAAQPYDAGNADAFVAKINASGNALVWSTYLGGTSSDVALGLALDASGNVYVTGYTASTDFPVTPNAPQPAFGGGAYDAFIAKFDASGALAKIRHGKAMPFPASSTGTCSAASPRCRTLFLTSMANPEICTIGPASCRGRNR